MKTSEICHISIITPVFEGRLFIEKCIVNVINQKDPKAEHIIIDGGSKDGTLEIIRKYSEKYPHITLISEKDRGQSDAMNKGIALARGSIISFLNVDDYYEPDTLNRVENLFRELPEPTLLVGNCNIRDEHEHVIAINKPRRLHIRDLLVGTDIFMHPVNPSAYFYHKSLHDRIGLYDTTDNYSMDLDFILRAVQEANVKYVDETFGNYRLIPGTKTYEDQKMTGMSRATILHRKYAAGLDNRGKIVLLFRKMLYLPINFIVRRFRTMYSGFLDYLFHINGRN